LQIDFAAFWLGKECEGASHSLRTPPTRQLHSLTTAAPFWVTTCVEHKQKAIAGRHNPGSFLVAVASFTAQHAQPQPPTSPQRLHYTQQLFLDPSRSWQNKCIDLGSRGHAKEYNKNMSFYSELSPTEENEWSTGGASPVLPPRKSSIPDNLNRINSLSMHSGSDVARPETVGRRSMKSTRSTKSTLTRHSSSKTTLSARSKSNPSPPPTPRMSRVDAGLEPEEDAFHNYMRAFYPFHPSTTVSANNDANSITIPINMGDVILVHSIHPNGWADGTLLASGLRGWLPTNYCEAYDHYTVRNLLTALTQLWDLVRNNQVDNLAAFTRQDYVRAIIAGVRIFLVSLSLVTCAPS
jgi:hypothetical protein